MPPVVSIDGHVISREHAVVSVYDRGFLYGDTIFETLRVYAGVPFQLEQHLERLGVSAELVGITLPVSPATLKAEVHEALATSAEGEAVLRITISRGEGPLGIDPDSARTPRRVIFVEPLGAASRDAGARGVSVVSVATRRAADLVPAAKVGAYLDAVVAHRAARGQGADDAIIVDPAGFVVEATAANVFAVVGPGEPLLLTPPEGALLPGITRRLVLELARGEGLMVAERPVATASLLGAAEVFLTSSVREIVPVSRIDGVAIGGGTPGAVTRRLQAAYRRAVG